jgi:hypothetical protein
VGSFRINAAVGEDWKSALPKLARLGSYDDAIPCMHGISGSVVFYRRWRHGYLFAEVTKGIGGCEQALTLTKLL